MKDELLKASLSSIAAAFIFTAFIFTAFRLNLYSVSASTLTSHRSGFNVSSKANRPPE
jgi:hypothetical protein